LDIIPPIKEKDTKTGSWAKVKRIGIIRKKKWPVSADQSRCANVRFWPEADMFVADLRLTLLY
jgi:hypothetical protein